MSFRPLTLLLLLALALPAAGQTLSPFENTPDHLQRYTECMKLARKEPLRALPVAEKWSVEGGGLGARHCVAVAMFQAGKYPQSAAQFEAIARDIALGLVSPEAAKRDYGMHAAHASQDVGEAKTGILVA